MPLKLAPFSSIGLDESRLAALLDEHRAVSVPMLQRQWEYYRNPMIEAPVWGEGGGSGGERTAQQAGLPARLQSRSGNGAPEVVIENDIAWRIDAMVDFVFGKSLTIESMAADSDRATVINRVLRSVLDANNSVMLLQDLALLASVHGHIDVLVRTEPMFELVERGAARGLQTIDDPVRLGERIAAIASAIRIELIDATRAIPILDDSDYRVLRGHVAVWGGRDGARNRRTLTRGVLDALRNRSLRGGATAHTPQNMEIRSSELTQRYRDGELTHEWPNRLGVLPIVHIQNASQPYRYAGISDVEPLIPLQNELNTRLSDRAHRVTMQSFKMFLAKGIEGFDRSPIAPGQVWIADDPDASIEAFGGDAQSPSEDAHIQEIRDAMDKASGISPVVLGVIRERLGHLSSENALRVTLMGVLSKTARKRAVYGHGIQRICELVLLALHTAGVLSTEPEDRRVNLRWPDPLPLDERDRIRTALLKRDLGVPAEQLLRELGYLE
jgi:hypothetical protein